MTNLRLEAALAIQERKQREKDRLERERRENQPAVKRKREEREKKREEDSKRWEEHSKAEVAERKELPLYEVIIDHLDVLDPKHDALRRRLIVAVKLAIQARSYDYHWSLSKEEIEGRRARAKEILALLETAS
jgi:hypothetical protein